MGKNNSLRKISKNNNSVFVIAEVSANHGQNYKRAIESMKAAHAAGVDAVKFQTYSPDTMTIDCRNKPFMINHPKWGGQSLYQLYQKASTPFAWFKDLKKAADDLGIFFFSTPFDKTAVDLLEEIDVPLYKIASFELVDLELIEYVAKTGKPLIISTGMGTIDEIRTALKTAQKAGAKDITLLKCVSSYPAKPEEMNLNTLSDMRKLFKTPVGLSDHTLGDEVAVAAVALGATVIEKHFTLSRKIKTPDNFFSMEPQETKEMVRKIRMVSEALGAVKYGLTEEEKKNLVFRRSLFVVEDMKAGEVLNEKNMRTIRPASGLHPHLYRKVLGKKVKKNIKRGTPLSLGLIQ